MSIYKTLSWAAVGTFAIGTESFVVAGVLVELARDFSISVSDAGYLVTGYALVYAIAAPVMATIVAPLNRQTVMRTAMALFLMGNVAAALAPTFTSLVVARLFMGLCAATFTPVAAAWASSAVAAEKRGRALAFVMAGFAVSTVVGVPVATLIGQAMGWRFTFMLVALMAIVALTGLSRPEPAQQVQPATSLVQRMAWLRVPGVAHALIVTWLTYTGCYCVYTYLAPLTEVIAGPALAGRLPSLLAVYGAAAVVGSLTGGWLTDRVGARVVIPRALFLVTAIYGALGALAGSWTNSPRLAAGAAVLLLVLWGLVGWQLPAAQQLNLIQLAPDAAAVVLSLQGSALYLGVSTGALLGSLTLRFGSAAWLGWVGAGCELLALLLWIAHRPQRLQAPVSAA